MAIWFQQSQKTLLIYGQIDLHIKQMTLIISLIIHRHHHHHIGCLIIKFQCTFYVAFHLKNVQVIFNCLLFVT